MAEFRALGLSPWLAEQARQVGLSRPTPVQAACKKKKKKNERPPPRTGRDCLGCAKTGSGKTAAFVLPVLQVLSEDPYGIFCLVLTPTRYGAVPGGPGAGEPVPEGTAAAARPRFKKKKKKKELAYQIAEQFRVLGKPLGLKDCVVVGGLDMVAQALELSRKPHVVIATPGRLADHLRKKKKKKNKKIKFLILDEADRLLEQGCADFTPDLEVILEALPARRQTKKKKKKKTDTLKELKGLAANRPFFWEAVSEVRTVDQLDQRYLLVPEAIKDAYLVHLIQTFQDEHEDWSIIIFTKTKKKKKKILVLNMMLRKYSFPSVALHSMMKKKKKKKNWATDASAAGLDIPTVQVVINQKKKKKKKIYIHRVGRTARAGRKGIAITLVTQYDIHLVHAIEDEIKLKKKKKKKKEQFVLDIVTQVNVKKKKKKNVSVQT
ncbi:DDX49 helicase, partial [Chroicocephalus maculipennis]|nr:DDX49 helicase [Chroicocephalus maculipennis]